MAYIVITDEEILTHILLTGITEQTLSLIHEHGELLQTLVEPVVNELYDNIYTIDHLQQIIIQYSTIDKLKVTQQVYLKDVFSPVINEQYIKRRNQIGKTHSRVGLSLHWFIATSQQYTQIIATYLSQLLPAQEAFELSNAIRAIFNFDMQITVAAYNEIEVDKAEFPLRYEFKGLTRSKQHVQNTSHPKKTSR